MQIKVLKSLIQNITRGAEDKVLRGISGGVRQRELNLDDEAFSGVMKVMWGQWISQSVLWIDSMLSAASLQTTCLRCRRPAESWWVLCSIPALCGLFFSPVTKGKICVLLSIWPFTAESGIMGHVASGNRLLLKPPVENTNIRQCFNEPRHLNS